MSRQAGMITQYMQGEGIGNNQQGEVVLWKLRCITFSPHRPLLVFNKVLYLQIKSVVSLEICILSE